MTTLAHRVRVAQTRIRRMLARVDRPAIMCSFGKDSLVVCDILAAFGVRDILYLDNIDEIVDEEYNAAIIERYNLRLHLLPRGRGILFFVRHTAQFFCYPFVSTRTMMPVPMALSPWTGGGDYLCVDDELRAHCGMTVDYNFDGLFFGQKRVDLLDGGGACLPWFPMLSAASQRAYHARMAPARPYWRVREMQACSPLSDWSQDDVWNYITEHNLPISDRVYDPIARRRRLHEHRACYRCHDPDLPAAVHCPKLDHTITNLGALAPAGPEALISLGLATAAEVQELRDGC